MRFLRPGWPRHARHWPVWLPLSLLILSMLACGGFQVRVTPTVTPPPSATPEPVQPEAGPTAEPTSPPIATLAPAPAPSATPTQAAGLVVGAKARVAATGGLNVRDKASAKGKLLGKLNAGAVVTLTAGPEEADKNTWWQVDNGAGLVGWVAAGPASDPWLVPDAGAAPAIGGGKLTNRPVRLGDRVQVTTDQGKVLTIRDAAGTDATARAHVLTGTQFVVRGGPVRQGGLLWWQLEGAKVSGWAAEGSGKERWLTPVEP